MLTLAIEFPAFCIMNIHVSYYNYYLYCNYASVGLCLVQKVSEFYNDS